MGDKMSNQKMFYAILLGAIAIALVFSQASAVWFSQEQTWQKLDENVTTKPLIVRGTATLYENPDVVYIYITVETHSLSAKDSQQENANKMQSVRNALRGIGISDIKTTNYNIYPDIKWENGTSKIVGYKTVHTIRIKSKNINNAGKIIDTAVNAGANRVDRVRFGLSDEKQIELRKEALKLAGQNAKEKAEAIAQGLGIEIVEIKSIQEEGVSYISYDMPRYMLAGVATGAPAETEITPGEIKFSATVSVTFGFI